MPQPPLVFIGDSITDSDRRSDADHLGFGWVRDVVQNLRERGVTNPVLNTGISGNRVPDLLARWDADALAPEPAVLTIYVGINDVWRAFDSADPTTTEAFESGYRALLERAVAAGVPQLILVEPWVIAATEEQAEEWPADLDPKREVVQRLASEFGAAFVPLQALVHGAAGENGIDTIAPDGVHPSPVGARLIAEAWLEVFATLPGWSDAEAPRGE